MTANVDAMVRAGVDAYRAGNKTEARTLLERAIELDSYNEPAWLWLSAVVDTKEEQQTCLENVMVINPENERARQGLKSLGIDPDTVVANAAAESTPAFEDGSFDDYAVPSSSASVVSTGVQASAEDYDDWVDGLEIGGNDATQSTDDDDLFGDIDFSSDEGAFALDDAIFDEPAEEDYDEDLFDDRDYEDEAYYDDGDDMFADIGTLEDFQDAIGDSEYNASLFEEDPFAPPPPDPSTEPQMDIDAYFRMIPSEVQAQRLPGTDESTPSIHYVLVGLLVLVNIGALAFVGFQFLS